MTAAGLVLLITPVALLLYSYLGYPLVLRLLARIRHQPPLNADDPAAWPAISITVPVYNEERQVRALLDSLLSLDYPPDRRQILIVSDASSDSTDEIVRSHADRGIEFLRIEGRRGKTACENAAAPLLRGSIVVNTDASIRIRPDALKSLIRVFADPHIGLASGRDISVDASGTGANGSERAYVDYEMNVRDLETRVAGIVGASGCFYAIRTHLHRVPLPDSLSRDFAAALITRAHGYRAVSVSGAVCDVPRTASLAREYRRKVRTITRGMETLFHLRGMLNPVHHGVFAWMLFSHKVCRWLVPWGIPAALVGLALLSPASTAARWALGAALTGLATGAAVWSIGVRRSLPRPFATAAFALAGNVAALHSALHAALGDRNPIWEPTRRDEGLEQSTATPAARA